MRSTSEGLCNQPDALLVCWTQWIRVSSNMHRLLSVNGGVVPTNKMPLVLT